MSLNKVMLIGNVGKDPDVRYLEGNNKVASFPLATSERFTDRSGQLKERTEWHNIVVFGKPAETVEKYVRKGSQLYVEGRIQSRSWDGNDGVKHYTTEINASTFQFLGKRDENPQSAAQPQSGAYQAEVPAGFAPQAPAAAPQAAPQGPVAAQGDPNDDLPF